MPPVHYHRGSFPPDNLDWAKLTPLLGPAHAAIARYDGVLAAIPNAMVLLSPLFTQEAILSARIEGTVTTMEEVLGYEAGALPADDAGGAKAGNVQEVINYRRAVLESASNMPKLPLCQRMVKAAHGTLLAGVRGQDKSPGQYRQRQNWIGPPDSTEQTARYVPIATDALEEGVSAWEKYLHSNEPDALVQLGIIHAEFEALHPFLDGNGRVGRMLIPLFLYARGMLSGPTFYASAYLEAHRDEYCERLLAVSRDGDWTGWCAFFLRALKEQGASNAQKAAAILGLYNDRKAWIADETRSQHAIRALDFVFGRPVFRASDFVHSSGIPQGTAERILRVLRRQGLLSTVRPSSGRRPAILAFPALLAIAEGRPFS